MQTRQQRHHSGGVAWRIRVSRMTNDAQDGILGQRAGRPRVMPLCGKTFMRVIVAYMCWINQCDQHICIQ